jgi:mRNA interferase RelE/StbE
MAAPYQIQYGSKAEDDVANLRAFDARAVIEAANAHLRHAPIQESRSRIKRMTQPFWSQFRLRVGELRVYYDVDEKDRVVSIVRVLVKGTEPTPKEQP